MNGSTLSAVYSPQINLGTYLVPVAEKLETKISYLGKQVSRSKNWIRAHSAYAQGRPCAGITKTSIRNRYYLARENHPQSLWL